MNYEEYEKFISEILAADDISYFLKNSIKELEKRDILDTLKDLELLIEIYEKKYNIILENH